MAAVALKNGGDNIPQWKKDLIARLKNQNKKCEERLWIDHHHHHHHHLNRHHSYPKNDLVCQENGFAGKELDSAGSSDSEDLHYGPGIVNRLRNKYLSLALRESNNSRATILRKATSLENLLDDNDGVSPREKTEEMGRFASKTHGNMTNGGTRYRSATRHQEMKRARSVEAISRVSHDEDATLKKINNRQSLHEEMLLFHSVNEPTKTTSTASENKKNGNEYTPPGGINRPKRIPPLLNEKEKPPVDVVKHVKMIFEKRQDSRRKPPHTGDVAEKIRNFTALILKCRAQTTYRDWKPRINAHGEVAAKVDSFNDIIVKTKVALKPLKPYHKPVPNEKTKSNTQSKPVAKPVILSESDVAKPKSLDLPSPKRKHNGFNNLPSPIPDVSRVVGNNGCDPKQRLCETPDLILTSSPLHKIAPKNCDDFLIEDRDLSDHPFEATNLFLSPIHSPTKQTRDDSFNDDQHQQEEPKSSAVYNFLTSQIDQRHLPKASTENRIKMGLSAFEIERNLKNVAKSETKKIIKDPVQFSDVSTSVKNASAPIKIVPNLENASEEVKEEKTKKKKNKEEKEEDEVKIVLPKKGPRPEEPATSAVFNFTSRKDVPDYISNDTSRAPSKLVIPKPDEPGIKLLSEALLTNFKEIQEVLEEEELIKSLEARPPSPCDVTFINDNVLIDGKSSLIQTNSKKVKLNISFLDNAEIYEYPSEISLLLEETHVSTLAGSHQVGHSVPALSGSLLATYTPKTTGDFQLGVTKTIKMDEKEQPVQDEKFQEVEEKPVLFSSGSTSDILF